jgi:hypothetical protein
MSAGRSFDRGSILVVPRRPGPLVPLATAVAERDDLDDLLDDIFGEAPTDGPGAADVVLAVGGLVLVLLARLDVLDSWAYVAGGAGVALSLVLPVRALANGARRRRESRSVAATLDSGTPLDLGDPLTAELADAYSALLVESAAVGATGDDARDLAHQTVLEAASLLRGRAPRGEAEREFIRTRTRALHGLAIDLAHARHDTTTNDAAVAAVERVDAGNGSVDRIESLRRSLRRTES